MKLQGITNSRQDAENYGYIILLSKYTRTIINQIFHRSSSNILYPLQQEPQHWFSGWVEAPRRQDPKHWSPEFSWAEVNIHMREKHTIVDWLTFVLPVWDLVLLHNNLAIWSQLNNHLWVSISSKLLTCLLNQREWIQLRRFSFPRAKRLGANPMRCSDTASLELCQNGKLNIERICWQISRAAAKTTAYILSVLAMINSSRSSRWKMNS